MSNCIEKIYSQLEVPSGCKVSIPAWKRPLDVMLVLLSAPLWAPVMAVIGLIIKLTSPGPVLFKQARIGFQGRVFTCLKFRTMHVNASSADHEQHLRKILQTGAPMVKMDGMADKRLIKAGRLLRATGLDELPQLFNVLRGEMSIVGPRPSVSYEVEFFTASERRRLNGLPGLTGLWQVSGKNKTTFQRMIELDVEYLETASPLKDLAIMFKTFPTLGMQVVEIFVNKLKNKNRKYGNN